MSIAFRPASENDLDSIHRIYNDAVIRTIATWDEEPWDWDRRLEWWEEHESPGCPVVVAADAMGTVVGFASLPPEQQEWLAVHS
ncbi:MAG TPA: hypothetical protein QGF35_00840 [Dehalococcoidia bacterium]|nr:hypothetical protein [Dehalococcoidia bacterium]